MMTYLAVRKLALELALPVPIDFGLSLEMMAGFNKPEKKETVPTVPQYHS